MTTDEIGHLSSSIHYVIGKNFELERVVEQIEDEQSEVEQHEDEHYHQPLQKLNKKVGALKCNHHTIYSGILEALQMNIDQTQKIANVVTQLKSR